MATMKKYLLPFGGVLVVFIAVLTWALFTRHLPTDKDGYRYEYVGGRIMQVKDFVPPPGTHLMQKEVDGQTVNYYGTSTEQ